MARCYLCGRILSEHPANTSECQCHDEHVIPNAIGGHLTDRHILCKECGGSLSKSNDVGFTDIFAPFIVHMQEAGILRPLDRNDKIKRSLGGFIFEDKSGNSTSEEIFYRAGKAIPVAPHYKIDEDNKIVNIYAEKKTGEHFINRVKKEISDLEMNPDSYEYKIHSDLMNEGYLGLNFTNGKPNFNKDFENGFLKIAIEMALHFGTPRDQLSLALEIDPETGKATYKEDVPIWPFIPQSLPDMILESERYRKDPNYPSHIVKVFSENNVDGKKNLICYIDLFSTFQYYVLLSDSYEGDDVDFTYAQKLRPNYIPKLEELQYLSPSDLDVELRQLNIPREWIDNKTFKQIAKIIYEEYRKQGCEFDLYKSLRPIYEGLLIRLLLLLVGKDAIKMSLDLDPASIEMAEQVINLESLDTTDIFSICIQQYRKEYYRKYLLEKGNGKLVACSYPHESHQYCKKPELIAPYTNAKFNQLSYFCFKEVDKKKSRKASN